MVRAWAPWAPFISLSPCLHHIISVAITLISPHGNFPDLPLEKDLSEHLRYFALVVKLCTGHKSRRRCFLERMHRFHYLHLHAHARKQVTQKSCVVLHAPEPRAAFRIHQLSKKCEVAISYVGGRKAFRTPAGVEKNCYHLGYGLRLNTAICTSISKGNYMVKCQKVDLMPIMILWLNYKDIIFLFMLLPLLKYEIKLLKMIKDNVRKRLLVGNNLFPDVTPKSRVLSWKF